MFNEPTHSTSDSPIDPSRQLAIVADGSSHGFGWVAFQNDDKNEWHPVYSSGKGYVFLQNFETKQFVLPMMLGDITRYIDCF